MKENRDILNEAFFKHATYEEKQKAKLPQYAPVDAKEAKNGSGIVPEKGAFAVADSEELKRRLVNTFGVTFGGNNVKSLASKAIKTFPIIVSDNVEPETVVMLKKLMEEQYAEYINLLISNQVIDLADYRANEGDGNIAIQAVERISGSSFGKSKLADKAARTGTISSDDVFSTIPLYTLLRENNLVVDTGDTLTNSILENALIVPADKSKDLAEFVTKYADDIVSLNENGEVRSSVTPDSIAGNRSGRLPIYKYNGAEDTDSDFAGDTATKIATRDAIVDLKRGYIGTDDEGNDIINKLTTADVVFDEKLFDQAINRSVGDLLTDKANVAIRDKFEKATFLLQSRRIAGIEYYQYLTLRLGIPVSDKVRLKLIREYKAGDVRDYSGRGKVKRFTDGSGNTQRDFVLSKDKVSNIMNGREIDGVIKPILKTTIKEVLIASGMIAAGGVVGTVGGLSIGSATGHTGWKEFFSAIGQGGWQSFWDTIGSSAFIAGPIIGAATGAGAYLLTRWIKKRKNIQNIEGWERVERLIAIMENRQAEIIRMSDERELTNELTRVNRENEIKKVIADLKRQGITYRNPADAGNEISAILDKDFQSGYRKNIDLISNRLAALAESCESEKATDAPTFNEMKVESINVNSEFAELTEEIMAEPELKASILAERAVRTTMPVQVKYVEKKPGANVLYAPANFTRSSYAYGSTEIERKENKDRRYNQPLIMKVTFKERYSDGKFADNELTAVIGILGKVIRIPSEEMQYILIENTKGKTIEGVISSGLDNTISDLLSKSKISNELKKLPQSADIWHNLEKVATLAAANSITGRRNNNIANAHIVFSQKEIDACRIDTGVDYLKDRARSVTLMKHYSAFTLMVANDPGQRVYIFDDQDDVSWNVLPYSALAGKDNGEQLAAALNKLGRL